MTFKKECINLRFSRIYKGCFVPDICGTEFAMYDSRKFEHLFFDNLNTSFLHSFAVHVQTVRISL
jgi:hypothetical protein